jgi:hypothetical protein
MVREGHAVRITTRGNPDELERRRAEIEAVGAECWVGTPDRLATLRAALASVTVVCWLLGTATGSEEELRALHGSRLEFFLGQTIDTTVRGFVYETGGSALPAGLSAEGRGIVERVAQLNLIPTAFIEADPTAVEDWLLDARQALNSLLG